MTSDPLGLVGTTLDERIAVESVVGEGGFGIVYRGRHLGFEEAVAVKCLKVPAQLRESEREDIIRRFKGEARMLHRLSRKTAGIVQALDVGATVTPSGAWVPYIVMEWLEGSTLEQDIRWRRESGKGPRSLAQAVQLLTPVAEALGVAHAHHVAHLDVKPGNLFLALDERELTVKLLDFGVAKVIAGHKTLSRALTLGTQGSAGFTPQYAAPEQFDKRHGRLGPHTDVFALGLILLELVAGRPALRGDTPLQLYMSAVNELSRPSFASLGVEAPRAAEAVVESALAVQCRERFGDAATMWQALAAALGAPEPRERLHAGVSLYREIAESATVPAGAGRTTGHNRLCTILVGELRGAAALGDRLDPEQVAELVDRCVEGPRRAIEEHGGVVHELAGERLVAIFGLGADELNAAERAVQAALAAREAVRRFVIPHRALKDTRLAVRIGVHTGRVYVSSERSVRVTGTPLHLATELGQRAAADTILIGRDTQRQVAGQFDLEPVSLASPAADEPATAAYRVLGAAASRHDLRAIAHVDFLGQSTAFVGREAELGRLGAAVDAVLEARAHRSVLVVGERGLGKSRLMAELATRLAGEGFATLAAHAAAASGHTSYGLVAALLRAQFHLHDDEPREVAEAKLRAGIAALSPAGRRAQRHGRAALDAEDIVEPLLHVLGYGPQHTGDPSTAHEGNQSVQARIAAALAAVLAAPERPLALLCDDVQWADEASLALLDELRLRLERPALMVCSAQPTMAERHPAWADAPERERIELGPLARRHLEQMSRDRLRRTRELPDALVSQLAERAEGSPLALVELLHLLVDAGAIATPGDAPWSVDGDKVGNLALPTTVQAIVQARIDRLGEGGRDVLCRAAVVGRTLWRGALAAVVGCSEEELAPTLAQLLGRQLLRREPVSSFPDEVELRFTESSTQEVAYEMLGASARRDLHKQVAEWLDARAEGDAMAMLLAHHYERSVALPEAAEAYARAARWAASLGHNAEAIRAFGEACRLDERLEGGGDNGAPVFLDWEGGNERGVSWPVRVRLRFELADVLRLTGELDAAEARYRDAEARIGAEDGREADRWRARVAYRLAMLGELRGQVVEPLALLTRAMAHADAGRIPEEKAQMLALVASLEQRRSDDAASEAACRQGLRVLRSVAQRTPRWSEAAERLLRTLGGVLYRRGRYLGAERCYLQGLRAIDERAYPHLASRVYNNVAAARYARGDVAAARRSFQSALALAEKSGEMVVIMTALANLGEVELALGGSALAVDYLEDAVSIGDRIGAASDLADAYRNLALARHALGRTGEAIAAAERALDLATSPGGRRYLPAVRETLTALCGEWGAAGARLAQRLA